MPGAQLQALIACRSQVGHVLSSQAHVQGAGLATVQSQVVNTHLSGDWPETRLAARTHACMVCMWEYIL